MQRSSSLFISLLSTAVVLAGCASVTETATENAMENMLEKQIGGNADVDMDDNGIHVETEEGTFTTGSKLPEDWPEDAPVYPGATVVYSATQAAIEGGGGVSAMLTTSDSADEVTAYYKTQLATDGWTMQLAGSEAGAHFVSATKGNRSVGISIAGNDDGMTSITIGV